MLFKLQSYSLMAINLAKIRLVQLPSLTLNGHKYIKNSSLLSIC